MKTNCKNIDITNYETIRHWVEDCLSRHKRRYDFKKYMLAHGITRDEYRYAFVSGDWSCISKCVESACDDAVFIITTRDFSCVPKVRMKEMRDNGTGKIRMIGCESPIQQILDYIAVYSSMEIFKRRMVPEQASSIRGRGQIYGKDMIQRWLTKDLDSERYATRHGKHYDRKFKYFVKLDIQKCYPSASKDVFLERFKRDCGNEDIVWLWDALLTSHQVDGYTGFMIGALPSQWACQYMLSFIYRYARTQGRDRRGKFIGSVTHMCMFMDDMLLIGSNRNQLRKAVCRTIDYTKSDLLWTIKPDWHIRDATKFDIDMMGFVIHPNGSVSIRSRNFVKARRMALRCSDDMSVEQARRISSYHGFFVHSDSTLATKKYHLNKLHHKACRTISKYDKEVLHGSNQGSLRN